MTLNSTCLSFPTTTAYFQITVFRMGSEGQADLEMAILTALLKGESQPGSPCELIGGDGAVLRELIWKPGWVV